MMSDVCKHCQLAPCVEVCPTGALIYNEFANVYVQQDICNGCANCVMACPFGVLNRSGHPPAQQVQANPLGTSAFVEANRRPRAEVVDNICRSGICSRSGLRHIQLTDEDRRAVLGPKTFQHVADILRADRQHRR